MHAVFLTHRPSCRATDAAPHPATSQPLAEKLSDGNTRGHTREVHEQSGVVDTRARWRGTNGAHSSQLEDTQLGYRPAGTGLGQASVPLVDNPRVGAGDLSCGAPRLLSGEGGDGSAL
jgi:hypothetical protein